MGTDRGLETRLVPTRGYELRAGARRSAAPQALGPDLLRLPGRLPPCHPGRAEDPVGQRHRCRGRVRRLRVACPPTWRPGAACRWSCTRPTPRPDWPTRSAPGSRGRGGRRGRGLRSAGTPGSRETRCGASMAGLDRDAMRSVGPGVLRAGPGRTHRAGDRRIPRGAAHQRVGAGGGAGVLGGRHRRAAPLRRQEHGRCPSWPARPMSRRPTSTGWTWPTPPPICWSPGPGR